MAPKPVSRAAYQLRSCQYFEHGLLIKPAPRSRLISISAAAYRIAGSGYWAGTEADCGGCRPASGKRARMKARVKWVEARTFVGESGSGHKVVLGTAHGPEGRTP